MQFRATNPKHSKLNLRVFLAGRSVAVVTYQLCHKNNTNMFISDWAVFWYHDCSINWQKVLIMTHQNLRLVKSWKLFWATLNKISPKYRITWEKLWRHTYGSHLTTFSCSPKLIQYQWNKICNPFSCITVYLICKLPAEIKQVISFVTCPCGGGPVMEVHL